MENYTYIRKDGGKGRKIGETYWEVFFDSPKTYSKSAEEYDGRIVADKIIAKRAHIAKFKVTEEGSQMILEERCDMELLLYI